MAIVTSSIFYDALLLFASLCIYWYLKFKLHTRYHWKRLNIPYVEPYFFFGNTIRAFVVKSTPEIIQEIYLANTDKPFVGIWLHRIPFLLLTDIVHVKNILARDFQHFHDRGIKVDLKRDPIEGHLVNLTGTKWRNLRVKLTPTFTSGKMKMMFPTMVKCGEELQEFLKRPAAKGETLEMKDILARFTTDIISSCAFGIQTNSLENPNGEFRENGRKIFQPGTKAIIGRIIASNYPILKKFFTIRRRPKEVTDFFMNTVKETIDHREKHDIKRNDFMDLIIQLKNKGKIEGADNEGTNGVLDEGDNKFTIEEAAAQFFVFFAAGFETSSTLMQFALYELAMNPDIQRRLQDEIDTVLAKHDNKISYEAVQEMDYLDCVVNESLRKYPPVPMLPRECTKDYTFSDTDVTIKKGTMILLSISGIQNDPRYFPNPEIYDPDRFSPEEKAKRDKFLHIPFGEGPRICIGSRFGLLQSKCGLISILSKYDVHVAETTQIPLKFDPTTALASPAKGMNLKITER